MKVLVTGGAGFIGTNLIKKLLEQGHEVVSIDNYSTGLRSNEQPGVRYVSDDIRYVESYSFFGEFDLVYHLAAIARIQPSFEKPYEYFTVNANGTFKIADYCAKNNVPLIYAGSSSHHSGRNKNPYTFSKDIGEDIIKLYQETMGLKASIARFYNVYGPHHLKEGGYTTLIGRWEKLTEENKPLEIYGDGLKRRDFTHVDDIVQGLTLIVEKEAWGNTFEFGSGRSYSVQDIADLFGSEIIYLDEKPGEAQYTFCDIQVTKKILGYEPKNNIIDYIKKFKNG